MATPKASFATISAEIGYNPKTSEGTGFLPPLLRTLAHLAYALGITEDVPKDANATVLKEVADKTQQEIKDAMTHLDKVEISENFSSIAQTQLKTFSKALAALNAEFSGWDRDTQVANLTTLIHRSFGISAMLDRELIGLRNSDAGSSL